MDTCPAANEYADTAADMDTCAAANEYAIAAANMDTCARSTERYAGGVCAERYAGCGRCCAVEHADCDPECDCDNRICAGGCAVGDGCRAAGSLADEHAATDVAAADGCPDVGRGTDGSRVCADGNTGDSSDGYPAEPADETTDSYPE